MYKTFSMEIGGRTLSVDVGRVAAQANGAAFMHYGDTTVLSTATARARAVNFKKPPRRFFGFSAGTESVRTVKAVSSGAVVCSNSSSYLSM